MWVYHEVLVIGYEEGKNSKLCQVQWGKSAFFSFYDKKLTLAWKRLKRDGRPGQELKISSGWFTATINFISQGAQMILSVSHYLTNAEQRARCISLSLQSVFSSSQQYKLQVTLRQLNTLDQLWATLNGNKNTDQWSHTERHDTCQLSWRWFFPQLPYIVQTCFGEATCLLWKKVCLKNIMGGEYY